MASLNPRSSTPSPPPERVRSNTKSAVALGMGVLGVFGAFFVFPPVVFSTLAIIFGALGRTEARRDPGLSGELMGTAGMVLGVLGFVVALVWVFVVP